MAIANLTLRFAVELAGIVALACWGFSGGWASPLPVIAGIAAPLALVAAWAMLVAPSRPSPLRPRHRELLGTGLLVLSAVALGVAGQPGAAALLGLIVVANQAALIAVDADAATEFGPRDGLRS